MKGFDIQFEKSMFNLISEKDLLEVFEQRKDLMKMSLGRLFQQYCVGGSGVRKILSKEIR